MSKKDQNTFLKRITVATPVAIAGFLFSFDFVFTACTAWASGIAPTDVIALANTSRATDGLVSLTENAQLSAAARNKAEDMLKHDYFAHTSPQGVTPWFWIKQAGYRYQTAGENLALNYDDALEQHSAWMNSDGHRANILNAAYREIGVAVVKGKIDGKESVITVELFGTPLHAIAEQMAAVPPVARETPAEIKGAEIQPDRAAPLPDIQAVQPLLENNENTAPVPSKHLIPASPQSAPFPLVRSMTWLDIVWLAAVVLLWLASIAPAGAFLFRAYTALLSPERQWS